MFDYSTICLQEILDEWNGLFTRHGLKINLEKTEVLHIGHQREARVEETDSGGQFRVPRRGSVRRREDGERGTSKSTGRSERVESSWGSDGGPADLQKTKGQGHEHLCDTGMPVRNGNPGNDWTTKTKAARVRKQLGTKNSKINEGRQKKNGGVKGRDGSAEELDRETGEEQITVGWTRRKDGGW